MRPDTIDLAVERLVRGVADDLLAVRPVECVCCYVVRMLDELDCDSTLRFAKRYRDTVAPRATALERRLGDVGGFCDCEIFMNGWTIHQRFWTPEREEPSRDGWVTVIDAEPPEVLPSCATVRRGSVRPCSNWVRQSRGSY